MAGVRKVPIFSWKSKGWVTHSKADSCQSCQHWDHIFDCYRT